MDEYGEEEDQKEERPHGSLLFDFGVHYAEKMRNEEVLNRVDDQKGEIQYDDTLVSLPEFCDQLRQSHHLTTFHQIVIFSLHSFSFLDKGGEKKCISQGKTYKKRYKDLYILLSIIFLSK